MTVGAAAACRKADDAVERKALDRDDVVIGKDVLELLSSAMYVDPMSVYREYVQNAADAIDAARTERLLGPDDVGTITIDIEPASRTVTIRDNGTGIGRREFPRRMTALGGSVKRGAKARGFRGAGSPAWAMPRSSSSAPASRERSSLRKSGGTAGASGQPFASWTTAIWWKSSATPSPSVGSPVPIIPTASSRSR